MLGVQMASSLRGTHDLRWGASPPTSVDGSPAGIRPFVPTQHRFLRNFSMGWVAARGPPTEVACKQKGYGPDPAPRTRNRSLLISRGGGPTVLPPLYFVFSYWLACFVTLKTFRIVSNNRLWAASEGPAPPPLTPQTDDFVNLTPQRPKERRSFP